MDSDKYEKLKLQNNIIISDIKNENEEEKEKKDKEKQKKEDKTDENENEDDYNLLEDKLNEPGTIEHAKLHSRAYRILDTPLEYPSEINVKFCKDCYYPEETKGAVKKFKYCSDIKNFTECGYGLYFFFFFHKILIWNLIGITLIISIPLMLMNYKYADELFDYCTEYYKKDGTNLIFPQTSNKFCENFLKGEEYEYTTFDWINKFSGEAMLLYTKIMKEVLNQDIIDKVVCNYDEFAFFCLLSLFIANLFFVNLSQALLKEIDFNDLSPSDYTLMISDLDEKEYSNYNDLANFILEDENEDKKEDENNNEQKDENEDKKEDDNNNEQKDKNEDKKEDDNNSEQKVKNEDKKDDDNKNINKINKKFFKFKSNIEEVKKIIKKKQMDTMKIQLERINITYRLTKIYDIRDEIKELKKIKIKNDEYYTTGYLCCKKKHEIKILDEKIAEKNKEIKILEKNDSDTFTGVIFVTFKEEKDAKEYRNNFPHTFLTRLYVNIKNFFLVTLCGCCFDKKEIRKYKKKQNVTVDWAPEPEDIIFANLEYRWINKFFRSLILYTMSILLMGASFGIVFFLNYEQHKSEKDLENNIYLKYGLSFAITAVTSGINTIVKILFQTFSEKEKMWTYTDKYLSLSVKLTIFTFLNSAVIPLFTNYIEFGWESHENLVNNMLTTFLSGSLLAPIMSFICYDYILNKFWIWFYVTRKYKDEKEEIKEYTQEELNSYFERPDMGVSVQYSNLAKQICMSMLYIPIFPLGIPITLLGIILNYFIEKFKCIYIYKRPEMLNQSICFFYMDYFCLALFCYAIGNYVFYSDTHSKKFYELFNIIFYAVIFILPYNVLLRKWNSSASDKYENLVSYDEAYFGFSFDYERINPKTQKQGMITYLDKLYENGFIGKEELEYCKNNIDQINLRETFLINSRTKTNNVVKLNNLEENIISTHVNQQSEEQHVNIENNHIDINTKNNVKNFINNFQFLINQNIKNQEGDMFIEQEENDENKNIYNENQNINNENKENNKKPKFLSKISKNRRPKNLEFNSLDLFKKKRETKNNNILVDEEHV